MHPLLSAVLFDAASLAAKRCAVAEEWKTSCFGAIGLGKFPLSCLFQSHSGSKVGQNFFAGGFQGRDIIFKRIPHRGNVDCAVSVNIEVSCVLDDAPRDRFILCLGFVGKL